MIAFDPEHPFVKELLRRRITRIMIINPNTPIDAQYWIKGECNKLVRLGATISFLELMDEVPLINDHWIAHRMAAKKSRALKRKRVGDDADEAEEGGEDEVMMWER